MSINRLLSSAVLMIAIVMVGLGGYVTLNKLDAVRQLTVAELRLEIIRSFGQVVRSSNSERGLSVLDLQTMPPGDQTQLAALREARATTDAAIAAFGDRVAAVQGNLDDAATIASRAEEALRSFKQYRQWVDEKIQLPLGQRGDAHVVTMRMLAATTDIWSQIAREQLRRVASAGGEAYRYLSLADVAWGIRDVGGRQAASLTGLISARKPVSLEDRRALDLYEGQVQGLWSTLAPLLQDPATPSVIKSALAGVKSVYIDDYGEAKKKVAQAFDSGDFPFDGPTWRNKSVQVWPPVFALRDGFTDLAAAQLADARVAAQWQAAIAGSVLLIALALAAAVLVTIKRRVSAPINQLAEAMHAIAEGRYETAIPSVERSDEIGAMAKAVVVFRDAGVAKHERDREIERERQHNEAQRQLAATEAIEHERTLVRQSIGAGLAKLADQDLGYRMTDDLPQAYRELQSDFNQAMQQLEGVVAGVLHNIRSMEAGSQQISVAADDLSRRTEQQAASLEETSASLEEITATVAKTAQGAEYATKSVGAAKTDADQGREVVRAAIEAMGDIERSSKQIGQIIGVIDEIAFQTNLLALNAGVEAARAGDAGRGFAVVASEVRALAQRSAEAAKEIKGLISSSTAQVDHGVGLVTDSGTALRRIVERIADVDKVVSEIAAGAKEQAIGLKEISTAVNQMDGATQRNAAMVEETTAASHSLLQQAALLLDAVSGFKVKSRTLPATVQTPPRAVAPASQTSARGVARGRI